MKNLTITLVSASALILSLGACKSNRQTVANVAGPVAVETKVQSNAAVHKVLYGEWIAYKVGDMMVTGGERPYVIFDGDNTQSNKNFVKVYANDGCNIINGAYIITPGGKMQRASEFISTLRMCPDAPYEMGMTLALNNVEKFELDKVGNDYLLNMKGANDSTLMILRKYDLNFINGAWAVTSVNGQKMPETSEMQLVIDTPEQKIHGNVGCNTMNGSVVIDPDRQNSIGFKNMITTRMTCPDIQLEQQLLQALDKVTTAFPADNMSKAELKDEAGNVIITLTRLNLRK